MTDPAAKPDAELIAKWHAMGLDHEARAADLIDSWRQMELQDHRLEIFRPMLVLALKSAAEAGTYAATLAAPDAGGVGDERAALGEMIYETTHLCSMEDDGSHRPIISKDVLERARAAYHATPAPARTAEGQVERVARAMWEAEPIVYGWNHEDRRRHPSWDDAVERNCYGVGVYRQFARAALAANRGG